MLTRTKATAAVVTAAVGVMVTGCSSTDDDSITLAVFNGWDESLATSLLWEAVLEEQGYNVELAYADPATVFKGIADGDYDVVTDVWLPLTHDAYIEEYGDSMEQLGAWFDSAALTIAVNNDAPITSLAELAENADAFGNQLIGIEPGSGLVQATEEAAIPTYGLEDMRFITSSTPAMLSELSAAIAAGENVVVTLWEPHWAYGAFPIRNLEDPEGTLGAAEFIYTYSRTGFSEEYSDVAGWFANFVMDAELLYELENLLVDADEADYQDITADWIADNRDWVDSLTQ